MLKPAYKLTIGRKAGGTSGLLGSASGALGGGDGKIIDTTDEPQASTAVDLTVTLDMEAAADRFTLVMGQVGGFRIGKDHQVTIELGYADDDAANGSGQGLTQVMVGGVVSTEPSLTTNRVIGHSAAQGLLRTFVEQTYESKKAGQIVSDLADQAGVEVATAEDGITFPAYVIDGRRDAYRHMRDLADLCGFDLYINSDDELVFKRFTGGEAVHVLEYARHIVELEVSGTPPQAGEVQAWGESPGGGGAEEAWAWLTKDFSGTSGSAGSGEPILLIERPALRTADAARTAADAVHTRVQRRTQRGRLLTIGRPQIKLGDAVRLSDVPEPDEALNQTYQVRAVTHRITKLAGFTTTVDFRAIET
jgi:hypothetical protein